jgi:hypothetical protein
MTGQLRRRCPLVCLALAELVAMDSLTKLAQLYSFPLHVFSKARLCYAGRSRQRYL